MRIENDEELGSWPPKKCAMLDISDLDDKYFHNTIKHILKIGQPCPIVKFG